MATANTYWAAAPVVRRVRAYFAPVNRTAGTPMLFDASEQGEFNLDSPPAPWISLGWVRDFVRKPMGKLVPVVTGMPPTVLEQSWELLDAQVSFHFLSWTKLTMALAAASQHMNLLLPMSNATASPDGGTAIPAVTIQTGATATFLPLAAADAATFSAGQMVAVDLDYTGQTGFVGSGVSGSYVKTALTDVNYIRRVTYNVARVEEVTTAGLQLAEPLMAGVPTTGMKAQALVGFVDREGGTFFPEWSGLFVLEGSQGERIFYHYPRLQPVVGSVEKPLVPSKPAPLEVEERLKPMVVTPKYAGTLEQMPLTALCRALPVTDPLDGELVLCYRSFLPAANALV